MMLLCFQLSDVSHHSVICKNGRMYVPLSDGMNIEHQGKLGVSQESCLCFLKLLETVYCLGTVK